AVGDVDQCGATQWASLTSLAEGQTFELNGKHLPVGTGHVQHTDMLRVVLENIAAVPVVCVLESPGHESRQVRADQFMAFDTEHRRSREIRFVDLAFAVQRDIAHGGELVQVEVAVAVTCLKTMYQPL